MKIFNQSRRAMLLGLAGVATAAATGSTATGKAAPQESAELLALADKLPRHLGVYLDARKQVAAIVREWGPQWPTPAPEIIWYGSGSKYHEDILGRGIETPWGKGGLKRVQNIGTPEGFKAEYRAHKREAERKSKLKSQRGMKSELHRAEWAKARIEPARAYWSEIERVTAASGIEPAVAAREVSRKSLQSLVSEIVTFEERSITGLIIKAQAMQSWGQVEPFFRGFNPEANQWADAFAATVMRQTAGEGA